MGVTAKILILFLAVQRIGELILARRNENWAISQGGMVVKEFNYFLMVLLHMTWIVYLFYIAFWTHVNFELKRVLVFGVCLILGQALRIGAILTLGKRWSTRIMILPGVDAVRGGLFQYFRHPNYLGVVIELASVPLIFGLNGFALIVSLLNGIILYVRVKKEEEYLCRYNNYQTLITKS